MTMRCPMRANMAVELAACDHECAWYFEGACDPYSRSGRLVRDLVKRIDKLESENAKLSSDELHWRNETEHLRSMYETISKALDDVLRIRGGVAS